MIPDTISVDSEKFVINFTTPSNFPELLLLPSDYTNHRNTMKKDEPCRDRAKVGYCSRKRDKKFYKRQGYIDLHALIKKIESINIMVFPVIIQR